jgi:hypothetical protein
MRKRHNPGCPCCDETDTYTVTITLKGCNGLVASGASAYATDGVDTYTATADANGVAVIEVPSTGGYTVTGAYGSRLVAGIATEVTVTGVGTQSPAAGLATHTMVPASGYHCQGWEATGGTGGRDCFLPLPNTLHLTDSRYGAVTLTFSTNAWFGSKSVSYPACGACPAGTISILYGLTATSRASSSSTPSFCLFFQYNEAVGGCPTSVGGSASAPKPCALAPGDVTCPLAFEATFTHVNTGTNDAMTHCSGTTNFTVTE